MCKKLKKILALVLSLVTVCSAAFTSMAEEVVVDAVEAVVTEVEEVSEVEETSGINTTDRQEVSTGEKILGFSDEPIYWAYNRDNHDKTLYIDNDPFDGSYQHTGSFIGSFTESSDTGWRYYHDILTNCERVEFQGLIHPTSTAKWFFMFGNLSEIWGIKALRTDEVTDMSYMFADCENLTSLDLSEFDTSDVTDMSYMFSGCKKLESLDFKGTEPYEINRFDTSNVTDMSNMFNSCYGFTSLDLSDFDTSNVTNMSGMFNCCGNLTSLDVSNFDTSKVTNISKMFSFCKNLTSLDLSDFDTSSVTDMSQVFDECYCLKELILDNWDTGNVANMNGMFGGCYSLETLDLSSFDTGKVTDMAYMFDMYDFNNIHTSKLTTIMVGSSFTVLENKDFGNTFRNCSVLVGGAGTTYDAEHIDKTYARIDQPDKENPGSANDKPGYFTGIKEIAVPAGLPGVTYVVKDETESVTLSSKKSTSEGTSTYHVKYGSKISITAVPEKGYTVVGTNPYVIEEVTAETVVNSEDLPAVEVKAMTISDILPADFPSSKDTAWVNGKGGKAYASDFYINFKGPKWTFCPEKKSILDKTDKGYSYTDRNGQILFNMAGDELQSITIKDYTADDAVNGTYMKEVVITDLEVTKAPDKTAYKEGEKFNPAGVELTLTYNNGLTRTVSFDSDDIKMTPDGELKASDKQIEFSVTVDGVTLTATQAITVKLALVVLTGIEITKAPTKTVYTEGESFDPTGMTVTAVYSNGKTEAVTDYQITPAGALKTTDKEVEISYTNGVTVTAKQSITVNAAKKPDPTPSRDDDREPLYTGTWNAPVKNGSWSQDAHGIWHYTSSETFRNTWGYIVNPYAKEGQHTADWFWFDRQGNMLTGWQFINGKWYYLNPTKDGTLGACQLGGVTPDGWTVKENGEWDESIPRK